MATFTLYVIENLIFGETVVETGLTEKVACAKALALSKENKRDIYTVKMDGSSLDGKSWTCGERIPASVGLTGHPW